MMPRGYCTLVLVGPTIVMVNLPRGEHTVPVEAVVPKAAS
jgi:hypothetical protein